jgi:transcriptional antiterminator RfaH
MAQWSAVRLQPYRERLALNVLARAGYETYCPRILHRRVAHGRKIETTPLLFPGYAFVAIVMQWYSAHYAPGVIGFLMDGERPARVPDAVIGELKSCERNGIIALPKKPGAGGSLSGE